MKNTAKIPLKLNKKQLQIIEEWSYHTSKLYNIANYNSRENGFKSYYSMCSIYKDNWHSLSLHSQTTQQCLKVLDQNWQSYFTLLDKYKKDPNNNQQPSKPRFKNSKNKNEVIFTKCAIKQENNGVSFSVSRVLKQKYKVDRLRIPLDLSIYNLEFSDVCQIRFIWGNNKWSMLIIYDKQEKDMVSGTNIMSIDLGLNNLATCTFRDNNDCYIINGRTAKSKNSYYNMRIAKLQSIHMKKTGNKNFKDTKQIKKLRQQRNQYLHDYMHKVSTKIINLALENDCDTILIGDFAGVKQGNHVKSFVQIPHYKLQNMIEYKAKLVGLIVVWKKETYTSGCSALDEEPVGKKYYNKSRRVARGLFVSNEGIKINADQNGSINILRKYIKCSPRYLKDMRDKGYVANPLKITID